MRLECAESPLARGSREKTVIVQEDNAGKCSEGFSKGSVIFQKEDHMSEEPRGSFSQDGDFLHDEMTRKREQALRQHAFFQLRLHIRRGANLVAMDRCGKREKKRAILFFIRDKKYIIFTFF